MWMCRTAFLGMLLGLALPSNAVTISEPALAQIAFAYDAGSVHVVSDTLLTGSEASPQPVLSLGLTVTFVAAKSVPWNPLNGPGPLGEKVAGTFRSALYTENALSQEATLYRSYGGSAGELGSYWTRTPPAGPLQSTMDSALNPAWGNTAQCVSTISVPSGTTIYEGVAAPQGGLLGGGSQIYIPKVNPNWLVQP